MIYQYANPPFSLEFRNMTKNELHEYYIWYVENTPIRISILNNYIDSLKGNKFWKADYTPESLVNLGTWLNSEIETQNRTADELTEIQNSLKYDIEVDQVIPTERTYSIAYDIGMYFIQVLIKNNPALELKLVLGNKKNISYGQPVVSGFTHKQTFNPHYMMIMQTLRLIEGKNDLCLFNLYRYWTSPSMI